MMQIAAFLVFLAMGVTNLLAVQAGDRRLGVPVLIALVVAVPVFYFLRFVGSAAGIVGAIVGWQMSVPMRSCCSAGRCWLYGFLARGTEPAASSPARGRDTSSDDHFRNRITSPRGEAVGFTRLSEADFRIAKR